MELGAVSELLDQDEEQSSNSLPQSSGISINLSLATPSTPLSLREAALFLMKAKEIHKISQSSLQGLIGDITTIVQLTSQYLKKSVEAVLANR